jgi:hypothetical protein
MVNVSDLIRMQEERAQEQKFLEWVDVYREHLDNMYAIAIQYVNHPVSFYDFCEFIFSGSSQTISNFV